jgi:hypothetical protein
MPFRSEDEHLREQIRRVEEHVRELLEEQASLEQQVKARASSGGARSFLALLVAAVAIGATTVIGVETGALDADKRGARRLEALERDEAARLDVERSRMSACEREREAAMAEKLACRHAFARAEWRRHVQAGAVPLDAPGPRGF